MCGLRNLKGQWIQTVSANFPNFLAGTNTGEGTSWQVDYNFIFEWFGVNCTTVLGLLDEVLGPRI